MFLRQNISDSNTRQSQLVLALATLADATQIEMILIVKSSKEAAKSLMFSPTNFGNVHEP
jgi:hypothetical protein